MTEPEQKFIGRPWQEDERVSAALRERQPSQVMLFSCCFCGSANYYNEGSKAWCSACDAAFVVRCEDEDDDDDRFPMLAAEDVYSVEDAIDTEVDASGP